MSSKTKSKTAEEQIKELYSLVRKLISQGKLNEAKKKLKELLGLLGKTKFEGKKEFKKKILSLANFLGIEKNNAENLTKEKKELLDELESDEDKNEIEAENKKAEKKSIVNVVYQLKQLEKHYSEKKYCAETRYPSQIQELLEQYGIMALVNGESPVDNLAYIVPKAGDKVKVAFVKADDYAQILSEKQSSKQNEADSDLVGKTLKKVIKENQTLEGILVAVEGYVVKEEDLQDSSKSYKVIAKNSKTGEFEAHYIQSNSVLAILDRALRSEGKTATYEMQSYIDTDTGKEEKGLLLTGVDEFHNQAVKEFADERNTGVLGFVNREEPGAGTISIDTLVPEAGDNLSLAYVLQGTYKGNYGEGESCVPLEKLE